MFRGVIQRLLLTLQALLDVSITSPGNNDVLAYDSASGLWKNKAGGAGGGVTSLNTETGDITLVAGSNVTITPSGTNITIASTGGSGTPGGSNTQVQYNNSGSFGGITGATTDGTALTLVAPVLGTPASGVLTNCNGTAASLTAGAVTNATFTTALTVNTGTLTLTANSANTSVLTIGAGAVSVSGSNTGDQTSVSGNAGTATALLNARTIGGTSFDGTANITVATATGGFTVSGGALALGTQNLTMTGSLAATGSRVTKGWFTDIESTNAPTIGGTAATGSGGLVRATSPSLVTPVLGTPTSGTLTNCTGLPNASVVGLAASATTDTTNAANISSGTIPSARLGTVGGTYIGDAVTGAQTLTLIQYAPYAMTLTALKNLGTVAGTVTGDLKINGTAVTGGSSLSLTSTPQNATLTAANSVSIGDVVTFVTSSPSSLTGLLPFTLLATR